MSPTFDAVAHAKKARPQPPLPKGGRELRTRPPLDRMQQIFHAIRKGNYPNRTRLAMDSEVTTKTVQRDLDFMRDRLNLPIAYNDQKQGYEFTQPVENLPVAIDDERAVKRAKRRFPKIVTLTTLTILRHWEGNSQVTNEKMKEILLHIQRWANYHPGVSHPDYNWWQSIVTAVDPGGQQMILEEK